MVAKASSSSASLMISMRGDSSSASSAPRSSSGSAHGLGPRQLGLCSDSGGRISARLRVGQPEEAGVGERGLVEVGLVLELRVELGLRREELGLERGRRGRVEAGVGAAEAEEAAGAAMVLDLGHGLRARGCAAGDDDGARGQVAQALAALAGGQHGHEPHEVEAHAVHDAEQRAGHDLALAGRAAALALDAEAQQALAQGLAPLRLGGVVVEECPADHDHAQQAGHRSARGKEITSAPAPTTARSTAPAAARRLSRLGPEAPARFFEIAFTGTTSASRAPEI